MDLEPESSKKEVEIVDNAPFDDNALSPEDAKLKNDLTLAVGRATKEGETLGVIHLALEILRNEIRTATSSMTSVPKPLKFLSPFNASLKVAFEVGQGSMQSDVSLSYAS